MTMQELYDRVADKAYDPVYVPVPQYLPPYHVHDPARGPEWNEAYIRKNNEVREATIATNSKIESDAFARFNQDLADAVMADFGITKRQADVITAKAYEQGHASGFQETVSAASELACLCVDFVSAGQD